jgi:hypothetical protein
MADNCRFCISVLDFEFDTDEQMNTFQCEYWNKQNKVTDNFMWVWPEMNYNCPHFKASGANAEKVYALEQKLAAAEAGLEAARNELKQYRDD